MRKLILFLLVFVSAKISAQVYQEMPQYGYRANRMAFDSTLQIPTVCGVPTIKSVVKYTKNGAIAYDSCNAIFYTYNPKTLTWTAFSGGGGSTDTTSLSNRINLKVNISDTSNMLTKYLRKTDTATLSNRINLKLNISDTTSMLNPYLRKIDTASLSNRINLKVPYTGATQDVDLGAFKISAQSFQVEGTNGLGHIHFKHQSSDATATGQSTVLYANSNGDLKYKNAGNYYSTLKTQQSADRIYTFQNKSYTLADSSDLSAKLNATDTASLSNRINLKLNIADTSTMLSKYLRKTDTSTLSNRINLKLNISDTATMLNPYLRKIDTATLSNRINLKLNISDTSILQPKSIPSYTFLANNTSATSNATAQYFKDTSGTYTGTITWGTQAPSGATTHTYRWTRIGNMVTLYISLVYATASTLSNATVTFALPSDAPTPTKPTGLNSASAYLYPAIGNSGSTITSLAVGVRGGLRNNAANNGFEIVVSFTSSQTNYAQTTVTYYTN
jgi:hypothetical protein